MPRMSVISVSIYYNIHMYTTCILYILVHYKYTNDEEPLELKYLVGGDVCLKNTVP